MLRLELRESIRFQTQNFCAASQKLGYKPNNATITRLFNILDEMASHDPQIANTLLGDMFSYQHGRRQEHIEELAEDIQHLQKGEPLKHRTVLEFLTDTQDLDDHTKELVARFVKDVKSLKPQEQEKETAISKPAEKPADTHKRTMTDEERKAQYERIDRMVFGNKPTEKPADTHKRTMTDEERKALDNRIHMIVFGNKLEK